MRGYTACMAAAIIIGGMVAGLQPVAATTYEQSLSIPNVTTVKAERGVPDKPPVEGYWEQDWPEPGEQLNLSAFVVNNGDEPVQYMLVFQVSYINNATQSIAWQEAELGSGDSQVISVPWTPDHLGYFEIDIFAVTNLEKPAPLSDVTLYQTYSRPEDIGQIDDLLPDLTMSVVDKSDIQQNQTGILGTFGYLVTADSDLLIPKNSTEINTGSTIQFELSDNETWLLKETTILYYQLGKDITIGREFDDYYIPAYFSGSVNILESDDEAEYIVDLSEGDYVFAVYTTFQYKLGDMLVDQVMVITFSESS